uniref:Ripply transcriptional repressor 1 n=1 Tax=Pelodiscus sinensis TaxID=13735 RepID=K7G2A2_PELSI
QGPLCGAGGNSKGAPANAPALAGNVQPKPGSSGETPRAAPRAAQPPGRLGGQSHPSAWLWRPWLPPAKDLGRQHTDQTDTACGSGTLVDGGSGKAAALFRHPVRLLWPRSRSFDYLYSEGEKLLENFPVQATISLYEDSDSEEEEEEEEGWGEEGQAEEGKQQ